MMTAVQSFDFLRNPRAIRRIAAITMACGIAGAAYGLLAPKWYRSIVTVVPATPQKTGLSGLLGAAGGLAAGLDSSLGGADASRIAAVLQSVAVTDAVIEKFDLRKRYGESYQETTRAALWSHCDVRILPKPNLVQLSCEDRDPRFVQQMLAYFAEYGNQVFRKVSVGSASEEVRFLEKRVAELRQQADDTSNEIREFQEKYKIIDLDTQAKAVVSALAALNSQRINKQLEFDFARTFSSGDEPTMRQLHSQLTVVDDKLRDLEAPAKSNGESVGTGSGKKGGVGQVFPAALAVPRLRADFEKLYRDRKVAEATLVFALERLEGARANEARDVSTFLVLDPPALPTRKSRPKGLPIALMCAALGLAFSGTWEWLKGSGGEALVSLLGTVPQPRARADRDGSSHGGGAATGA